MGFNSPTASSSSSTLYTATLNQISVDGINVKVLPAGTSPNVVYRIGDGTVHPDGWDNVVGEKYLDFYISTGATGATGIKGENGASAFTQAVENGYAGTEEEFYELLNNVAINAIAANESAIAAANSATSAANSATSSANSATNASNSATNASNSATEATTQAGIATSEATSASASASLASNSASSATNSATSASYSATSASNSAIASAQSAINSENSAIASAQFASEASASAALAATYVRNPMPMLISANQTTGVELSSTIVITDSEYNAGATYVPTVSAGSVVDNSDGTYTVTLPDYSVATVVTFTLGGALVGYDDSLATIILNVTNTVTADPNFTGSATEAQEQTQIVLTNIAHQAGYTYTESITAGSIVDNTDGTFTVTLPDYATATSVTATVTASKTNDIDSQPVNWVITVNEVTFVADTAVTDTLTTDILNDGF